MRTRDLNALRKSIRDGGIELMRDYLLGREGSTDEERQTWCDPESGRDFKGPEVSSECDRAWKAFEKAWARVCRSTKGAIEA